MQAKRAKFTFLVDKMVNFGEFLKLKLAVKQCYQTGKFFYRTKIGGKCQKLKKLNDTFWMIFGQ